MNAKIISIVSSGLMLLSACNDSTDSNVTTTDSMNVNSETADASAIENGGSVSTTAYVDLKTNKPVELVWDEKTKKPMNRLTNEPVDLYVNTATRDTLYGPGYVVNGYVINTNGAWTLDNAKVEIDGDEVKVKDGNTKLKIEDGEWKLKTPDGKMKGEDDEMKIKTDSGKWKVEEGESKVKQ